jgi:hypothetical protein
MIKIKDLRNLDLRQVQSRETWMSFNSNLKILRTKVGDRVKLK